MKSHSYNIVLQWTGNTGKGTEKYTAYERSYTISVDGKPKLEGSSDPAFRGDSSKYNPEELLVAALSSCHMLWYLNLCSNSGVKVLEYRDHAKGQMELGTNGTGKFTKVTLEPKVVIEEEGKIHLAKQLHSQASKMCYIAKSVNFEVLHAPTIMVQE